MGAAPEDKSGIPEEHKNEDLVPALEDDVVEGHGIEEDDSADAAESLTVTGACFS